MRRKIPLRRILKLLGRFPHLISAPQGIDVSFDIAAFFPRYRADTVFDVGANVGQSASMFLSWFPQARIYSFEPVRSTYAQLQANMRQHPNVHCFNLAFGASQGQGQMVLQGKPDMFFLSTNPAQAPTRGAQEVEEVEIATLDEFCRLQAISHIGYLKIDTEGGDFKVLLGAEALLAGQHVDIIEVEAGMSVDNTRHVPFEQLKDHLQKRGYALFGIYEQTYEWPTNQPHLRRVNPVFIARHMIDAR
jgi:FkbM family methyltransferase